MLIHVHVGNLLTAILVVHHNLHLVNVAFEPSKECCHYVIMIMIIIIIIMSSLTWVQSSSLSGPPVSAASCAGGPDGCTRWPRPEGRSSWDIS